MDMQENDTAYSLVYVRAIHPCIKSNRPDPGLEEDLDILRSGDRDQMSI